MDQSPFSPEFQNWNIDAKIVGGLEKISEVFRIMLWEESKKHGLSPIQIQLLVYLKYHTAALSTVSYLAREFNLTKPTISDAIKALEQKKLIRKNYSQEDTRSYSIALTPEGNKMAEATENFANPLGQLLASVDIQKKTDLWEQLALLIHRLNQTGLIQVQRMCFNCQHYELQKGEHFCKLINHSIARTDLRLDCPDHQPKE